MVVIVMSTKNHIESHHIHLKQTSTLPLSMFDITTK